MPEIALEPRPGDSLGPYRITRVIGRGRKGVVFEGTGGGVLALGIQGFETFIFFLRCVGGGAGGLQVESQCDDLRGIEHAAVALCFVRQMRGLGQGGLNAGGFLLFFVELDRAVAVGRFFFDVERSK